MLRIRQLLKRNGTDMRWANGSVMLADGLAKSHDVWQIARFLNSGQICILVHDPNRHNAKWQGQNDESALEHVPACCLGQNREL